MIHYTKLINSSIQKWNYSIVPFLDKKVVLVAIKIGYDLLMTDEDSEVGSFCQKLNNAFELGTIVSFSGILKF